MLSERFGILTRCVLFIFTIVRIFFGSSDAIFNEKNIENHRFELYFAYALVNRTTGSSSGFLGFSLIPQFLPVIPDAVRHSTSMPSIKTCFMDSK